MRSNISANGKLVVYIKSTKDVARGEALLHKALNGRATIIDKFVETSVRKNYKPELEKAVKKCNSRAAKLIIPNIGHLPRSLAFCNALMKLEGNDPFVYAIREFNNAVSIWNYHVQQMYLQCIDTIALHSKTAKKALRKKIETGWKAGNPVNLDEATSLSSACFGATYRKDSLIRLVEKEPQFKPLLDMPHVNKEPTAQEALDFLVAVKEILEQENE